MRTTMLTPASLTANNDRAGVSIVELLIAAAMMTTLTAAILRAWTSYAEFHFMVNKDLEFVQSMNQLRATIADDFGQSTLRWPYDATAKSASQVNPDYPRVLSGGREIRFVRFRTTLTPNAVPSSQPTYAENFTATNPWPLSNIATSPVSQSFLLNTAAGVPGFWNISPVWDSPPKVLAGGAPDPKGLTFIENANDMFLRIYRYALIPYSRTVPARYPASLPTATSDNYPLYSTKDRHLLRGMLVRQYAKGTAATEFITIGAPLCDTVVFYSNNIEGSTPFFVFSAYDGVTNTGNVTLQKYEVQLKMTVVKETTSTSNAIATRNIRLSFPLRQSDYGQ